VPIRRGYAGQGRWAENYGGCERANYYDAGLAGARDIEAAIAAVSKQPRIDRKRIVLMGWSAGGWASLAAATKGGILGVVNFAAGRGSKGPDEVCEPEHLVEAARRYGKASRVPELWIYSLNDRFFGPDIAHRMYDAFVAAGAKAEFVAAPAFGDDGHRYFTAIPAWRGRVDKFLRSIGFL
jgi:dienelactone hydrolase